MLTVKRMKELLFGLNDLDTIEVVISTKDGSIYACEEDGNRTYVIPGEDCTDHFILMLIMKNEEGRKLITHLANIDAIQKVETILPFGFTVIHYLTLTILVVIVTILLLSIKWNFF